MEKQRGVNMYDKEKVYDEKIYPLMGQIIEICKENDMQIFATYLLKEHDEIVATTYLESQEYNSDVIRQMVQFTR